MPNKLLPLMVVTFLLISPGVYAYIGPATYHTEQVLADYYWNGSPKTAAPSGCPFASDNPCRYGFLEASVPNNDDVLQYLRINFSAIGNTDLNTITAYRGALASYPNANDKSRVYVNTTLNDPADEYNITSVVDAPDVQLSFNWTNYAGGIDVFDADNIYLWNGITNASINVLNFTLTVTNPSNTQTLSNILIVLNFSTDTGPSNEDVINISTAPSNGNRYDTDSDGYFDFVNWTVSLNPSQSQITTFNVTIHDDLNWNDTDAQDLDGAYDNGVTSDYADTGDMLTNLEIIDKFTRGPIRIGTDLSVSPLTSQWQARGFIENIGETTPGAGEFNLTYNISEWRLYEVNQTTGAPQGTAVQSGIFDPSIVYPADSRLYTTDKNRSSNATWWTTGTTKPYVASYFNWYVIWNETNDENNFTYINTTLDLPTLYKIDMYNTKPTYGFISPDTGNEPVYINDSTQHVGSTNAKANYIQILSYVPANTSLDLFHGIFIINTSSVEFYYQNSTSTYELVNETGVAEIAITQSASDGSADGLINLTIWNLSQTNLTSGGEVGRSLDVNEKITIFYQISTHVNMTTGDSYNFTGNTTMMTDSGTPLMEPGETAIIYVSARRLIAYKDIFGDDVQNPNLINATINLTVQDGTGSGISGIKFVDYVSPGTDLYGDVNAYRNAVTFYWCNTTCNEMTHGVFYTITDNGTQTLPDGTTTQVYEFVNSSGDGWVMYDDYTIVVQYRMNITTSGLYVLPVTVAGYDPLTGETFTASAVGVMRVTLPEPNLPLDITESDLKLAKRIVVGKPAIWAKTFDIFNPNPRQVDASFETEVFPDTSDGYASYYDEGGKRIEEKALFVNREGKRYMMWTSVIGALESRSYELSMLTPPVLEIDRDVEVLEKLADKKIKLKMDIYLKSFAMEDYENIILNLPIPYQNIFEAKDAFGNKLAFTGGADTSTVTIPSIGPDEMKTVTIVYAESYPTIIVTPDRDRYDLLSPVSLEILVINGGEKVDYPYIETEIYTPNMVNVFSNITQIESLEPLEKTEVYERFIIPMTAPTGMYVTSARFREDFSTLASYTGNFYVSGMGAESNLFRAVGVIIIIGLLFLVYRRIRMVRRDTRATMTS